MMSAPRSLRERKSAWYVIFTAFCLAQVVFFWVTTQVRPRAMPWSQGMFFCLIGAMLAFCWAVVYSIAVYPRAIAGASVEKFQTSTVIALASSEFGGILSLFVVFEGATLYRWLILVPIAINLLFILPTGRRYWRTAT